MCFVALVTPVQATDLSGQAARTRMLDNYFGRPLKHIVFSLMALIGDHIY